MVLHDASLHGNTFHIIVPLWWESTGVWWGIHVLVSIVLNFVKDTLQKMMQMYVESTIISDLF